MRTRSFMSIGASVAIASALVFLKPMQVAGASDTPAPSAKPTTASLKTAWGEPDLQGIWTDETATPLQRPARYANQEFFSEAERAELDRVRSEVLGRER